MKIDLRYPIIAVAIVLAGLLPIYILVGAGMSLGWSLEEAREAGAFIGGLLGLIAVFGILISAQAWLAQTRPVSFTLWEDSK